MTPPFSFPSGVRGPCAIFVASNKFARIYIARYPALRFELSDVYYVFPGAKRTVAVTGQNVIQESKSIIQKMRDTPKKDISGTCETRSWELLSTTDRFHALLRHYCEWFFKRVALLAGGSNINSCNVFLFFVWFGCPKSAKETMLSVMLFCDITRGFKKMRNRKYARFNTRTARKYR